MSKQEAHKKGGKSASGPRVGKSALPRSDSGGKGAAKQTGGRKAGTRPSLMGEEGSKPLGDRRLKPRPGDQMTGKPAGKPTGKPAGKPTGKPAGKPTGKPKGKPTGKPGGRPVTKKADGDLIRLNKYIASAGICSRREADDLISAGLITVNGTVISILGSKIKPGDEVKYNGERIRTERKVYLLLNKPKDYVTTTDDPKERKTVMLLISGACNERVYPVGRLDRNTTGVLLFTNDGEMAKKMTHPSHNKKKIYHVFLDKALTSTDMTKLAGGLTLEDGFVQPDALSYVDMDNKKEVGLEIHSGKNRIVRRMFESLGYRVNKLDRVYFAGLTKKNLPRGKWRLLSEKEITRLKMNAYE